MSVGGHSLHHNDWMHIGEAALLGATGLGAAGIGPMAGLLGGGAAAGAGAADAAAMGGGTAALFGPTATQAALLGSGAGVPDMAEILAGAGSDAAGGVGGSSGLASGGLADTSALGSSLDGASPSMLAQAQGMFKNPNFLKTLKIANAAYSAGQPPQQQAAARPMSGPSPGLGTGAPISLWTPPTVTQTPGFGGDSSPSMPPPGVDPAKWLAYQRQLQMVGG